MQKKIMYHAAIYLRLSRDDEDIREPTLTDQILKE